MRTWCKTIYRRLLIAGAGLVLTLVHLHGQPQLATQNLPVLLKVPPAALTIEPWNNSGTTILSGTIAHDPAGRMELAVNGRSDWQALGFPTGRAFIVERVRETTNYTDLELRSGETMVVKLRFLPSVRDVSQAYRALVVPEPVESEGKRAFGADAYAAIASRAFANQPFVSIPKSGQARYLEWAHLNGAWRLAGTTYRDRRYVHLDLGLNTSVYDAFGYSKTPLILKALNDRLLATLRSFITVADEFAGVDGVQVSTRILYRAYLDGSWVPSTFDLTLFATAAQVRRYAAGDLTDRQFVHECVVLLNDTPIQVSLPAWTTERAGARRD